MRISGAGLLSFLFLFLSLQLAFTYDAPGNETKGGKQIYIVYMGHVPPGMASTMAVHHTMLYDILGDTTAARESLVHSYGQSFNGFAARLHLEQAERIKGMHGVVSVFPNKMHKLHTTRSYDYIGLTQTAKRNLQMESDVIIGIIDTGIYMADSPSFSDKGMGPPPAKWKGTCQKVGNFTGCNNKVIGARYFYLDNFPSKLELSPLDFDGHGTHTASTAGGSVVEGANLYGMANGTARGAVPAARLAIYKVCWANRCSDMDILAAFDAAIADGVDILSISLSGGKRDFLSDTLAIGAFHASKNGIFTACSAGNWGPYLGMVSNNAPWILTVGASSTDRKFFTNVGLGNGKILKGLSINTFSPTKSMYPLISGKDAKNASSSYDSTKCWGDTLDRNKVRGKIVFCEGEGFAGVAADVRDAGGYGVLVKDVLFDVVFPLVIPGAYLDSNAGNSTVAYLNTTKDPQAVIYRTRTVLAKGRPFVAYFSSRGPSIQTFKILKPDLVAPGINILAAYSPLTTFTGDASDNRVVTYNVLSGTSMACPHAAGIAAYVKSFHPAWSPAAIKSALMTTAKTDLERDDSREFGSGAGMIDPIKALNPGLVYDADSRTYIGFLCKENYTGIRMQVITGENVNCSSLARLTRGSDGINYPSMQYLVPSRDQPFSAVFWRQVTNVGSFKSVYRAQVDATGFNITVSPDTLRFTPQIKKRSFKVVIRGPALGEAVLQSGELVWSDSIHRVRSPIVVFGHSTDNFY